MQQMGLFKLGKKRDFQHREDENAVTTVTNDNVTKVAKEMDGILVQDQRRTQISIIIGEDREFNISNFPARESRGVEIKHIPCLETKDAPEIVASEDRDGDDRDALPRTSRQGADREPLIITDVEEAEADAPDTAKEEIPVTVTDRIDVAKSPTDTIVEEPLVKTNGRSLKRALEKPAERPADNAAEKVIAKPVNRYQKIPPGKVGTIYGNVGTNSFDCHVCARLERSEYVMVNHEDYGPVLCQVGTLVRKSNLSLEKSMNMSENTDIKDVITAHIDVIGYRDERNLLLTPRTTFMAGSDVNRADPSLIRNVLGLGINPNTDGYIGILHGHDIPIALNINELLQRHACILAKTGGGKSYMSGDIIEELMKHNVTCMVIDPHGEYGAMRETGVQGDPRFKVKPKGYKSRIREFAVSNDLNDKNIKPLRFTFRTLEAKEILELLRSKDSRTFLPPIKKALEKLRESSGFYSVRDLIDVLNDDTDTKNPVLVAELEYIDEMGVFAAKGNAIDQLIEDGKTTVINLKGVSPDIQQLIVKRLSTVAFELRKKNTIPPMMMIVEEAHNYCPQGTQVLSSKPLATIASEGRKFGLGLLVISQRPAKIDKNVLSQCGTQIILKVTNPNDVKAISQSIEGLTNGMTDEIQTMPIGMAMVVGAGIESPLLVEVRPRESRHGGAGIKVLEDSD